MTVSESAMWARIAWVLGLGVWTFLGHCSGAATSDALPRRGLLFSAGFNSQSEKAEFSLGKPESINFARTLQYGDAPGVVKAGFQTMENERCDYEMVGNFDPQEGTLSLWVRPENWRSTDKRSYVFFAAETPGKYRLLLFKPAERPGVALQIALLGKPEATHTAHADSVNWQPKEWHKLDATWSATSLKVYVDGEFVAEEAKDTRPPDGVYRFPPAEAGGVVSVNPNNYLKGDTSSPSDKTSVDEVKVFDRALSAEEIRKAYAEVKASLSGSVYRSPLVVVPFSKTPVKLDGRLEATEWEAASLVPIQYLGAKAEFANHFGNVRLKYDNQNLYLGFHATGERNPIANVTKRDGWVWEDGTFEFVWQTAEPTKASFQFVINSANTIFDIKNNDAAWNGVTATAAGMDGDGWSAEVALSYTELGVGEPKPGTRWTGNFMHDWNQRKTGYATWAIANLAGETFFGNASSFGSLVFGGEVPGARLESLGDLTAGKVNVALSLSAKPGAPDRTVSFKLTSGKATLQEESKPVKPAGKVRLETPAPSGEDSQLSITVSNPQGQVEMIYDQVFRVKPPIVLTYKCWPQLKRLDVDLDLTNMDDNSLSLLARGELKGEVQLTDSRGAKVLSEATCVPKAAVSTLSLPFPEVMAVGQHLVKVSFPRPDGGRYEAQKSFEVPSDEPLKALSGVDHEVPDPWTPIEVSGNKVKMLDREYWIGKSPFPVRMTSLGNRLLARPVELIVTTKHGQETFSWNKPRVKETFPDEVLFEGTGKAARAGLTATYKARLEFDGQWLVTLALAPAARPVEVESLHLRYAVADRSASYVLAPLVRHWENNQVALDLFDGLDDFVDSNSPKGGFWLTGLKTGLYFLTTTNGNWAYKPGQPNTHIAKSGGQVKVEVDIVGSSVSFERPAAYVFGLTGTPARRWPAKDFLSGDHEYIFQAGKWQNWVSLVMTTPDILRKDLGEKKHKTGARYFYQYSCPVMVTGDNPYEDYWGATWTYGSNYAESANLSTCPNSGVRDLIAWQAENLARDFGVGPYFDMSSVGWCDNQVHGCGYTDSFGKLAKTVPILGFRDEMKRIYKATHRNGCKVWNHNHSLFDLPAHTFSDIWFPGEQYTSGIVGKDHFYSQLVPRDNYLVEMSPFLHGMSIVFLPEYGRAYDLAGDKDFERWHKESHAWAAEQLLAMLLPHNIDFISAYMCPKPGNRVTQVFREQGVTKRGDAPGPKAVFTGYWDNPKITPDDSEVLLSYYTFPGESRILAVASNPTLRDRTIKLNLQRNAMGSNGPVRVRDEYRNEELQEWETKGVPIPHESFRLLLMKPASG